MDGFTYDPDTHSYALDGAEIPGITRVMRDLGCNPYYRADPVYRARGKAVHQCSMWVNHGEWDRDETDPRIVPYVDGWVRFVADYGYRSVGGEEPVCSRVMRVACTPDDWGPTRLESGLWLIERKSGTIPPLVGVQLAGQAHMLAEDRGLKVEKLAVVCLPGDGSYEVKFFSQAEYHQKYLSMVKFWYAKKEAKLL